MGDLVTLHDHCRDSGRLGIIAELPNAISITHNACKVQWIDEEGLREPPVCALLSNIVKLETKVENEEAKK